MLIVVKHTLFDGRYVEQGDAIDSIMNSIEVEDDPDYKKNERKVISQIGALSYIYDFDEIVIIILHMPK